MWHDSGGGGRIAYEVRVVGNWLVEMVRYNGLITLSVRLVIMDAWREQDLHDSSITKLGTRSYTNSLRLIGLLFKLLLSRKLANELPEDFSALHEQRLLILLRILALATHKASAKMSIVACLVHQVPRVQSVHHET